MAIQECMCNTPFSVYILCCNILNLWLMLNSYTIALKPLNEMQQTVSMSLTIIPHDITVIYVTYVQMYCYLMQ